MFGGIAIGAAIALGLIIYGATIFFRAFSKAAERLLAEEESKIRAYNSTHSAARFAKAPGNSPEIGRVIDETLRRRQLIGSSILYIDPEQDQEYEVYLN